MENLDLEEYYHFLDKLRESGTVNMFGSSQTLREYFCLERRESNLIVASWMHTFNEELTIAERAADALKRGLVT